MSWFSDTNVSDTEKLDDQRTLSATCVLSLCVVTIINMGGRLLKMFMWNATHPLIPEGAHSREHGNSSGDTRVYTISE